MTNKELGTLACLLVRFTDVETNEEIKDCCFDLYAEVTGFMKDPKEDDFLSKEEYETHVQEEYENSVFNKE